jgi:hypothetical protein
VWGGAIPFSEPEKARLAQCDEIGGFALDEVGVEAARVRVGHE